MTTIQRIKDLSPRTKLRLSEIERILRTERIIVPVPSRSTLIEMCEEGTFKTAPRELKKRKMQWLVYEDSFLEWIASMDDEQ